MSFLEFQLKTTNFDEKEHLAVSEPTNKQQIINLLNSSYYIEGVYFTIILAFGSDVSAMLNMGVRR